MHTHADRRHDHWRRALTRLRLLQAMLHRPGPPAVATALAAPGHIDTEGRILRTLHAPRRGRPVPPFDWRRQLDDE